MKIVSSILFTAILFGLAAGCGEPNPSWKFKPSFYYWKTTLSLDEKTHQYLGRLGVERLYIRVFDVSWNSRYKDVVPNGPLQWKAGTDIPEEMVPVIYLTREALTNLKPSRTKRLAEDILQLTRHLCHRLKKTSIPELQIDCDWTPSTKEAYFSLLEVIKARMPKLFPGARLSCTIRLSQVKYREAAGVPPVDRGTLMVYHTASPAQLGPRDSILNLKDARSYLASLPGYPLPLDVALPVFSWAVIFSHDRKPLGILNDVGLEDLKNNSDIAKKGHNIFSPVRDTYLKGRLVQKGDWIKVDQPDRGEVEKTLLYLKSRLKGDGARLILFHLDDSMIRRFTDGQPDNLSSLFNL